jgi:protease-4
LQEGLVDELAYRHEIRNRIKDTFGMGEKFRTISSADYFKAAPPPTPAGAKAKIAVVGAFGTIIAGNSPVWSGLVGGSTLTSRLREVREDSSVDGVILRVDSPGGSAVGSDMIWREVRLLEESGKPVVVSMSGTAGSGGYYIAMGASRIVSHPSTITGSIGVMFGKFDLSGLYHWLGMDVERIKLAPNADLFSAFSSLTPEQLQRIESWLEATYRNFVNRAAEGRGVPYEEMEPKAQGRIYTGSQALEEGLVDRLGGLSAAAMEMKTALGLEAEDDVRLELFPRPKTFWELLFSGELLEVRLAGYILERIPGNLRLLETPSVWLLTPEINIY